MGGRKAVKLKFDPWWVFLASSLMCYIMSDLIKIDAWWVQKCLPTPYTIIYGITLNKVFLFTLQEWQFLQLLCVFLHIFLSIHHEHNNVLRNNWLYSVSTTSLSLILVIIVRCLIFFFKQFHVHVYWRHFVL